ncbi:MAG TPA: helix-turn-helix transcriptional regulator [Sedimentisphaerales bacterium]|nr:helix-turn-helix transcriptional regulator [Sedimentisphaerales bacterium]
MKTKYVSVSASSAIVVQLHKEGFSQKRIADSMGVSESFISHVKQGRRSLTINRLSKLEESLETPLPLLFLKALDEKSIPKALRSQYKLLRQVFINSTALRKKLSRMP